MANEVGSSPVNDARRRLIVAGAVCGPLVWLITCNANAIAAGRIWFGRGRDSVEAYRPAAYFVDRILKGARPAKLPMEQLTKYEMVLELKTDEALGIAKQQSILVRANKVVE